MKGKNHALFSAASRAYNAAFLGAFETASTELVDSWSYRISDGATNHVTEHFGTLDKIGVPELKDTRVYADIVWHSFETLSKVHARGLKVSREDMRMDRWGQHTDLFRQHGRLMRTEQKHAFLDALTLGFTTGRTYDGATLYSTTHTTNSGATWSNRITQALDDAAFEEAMALLLEAPMPDGDIMAGQFGSEMPVQLYVGPKNKANAMRIVDAQFGSSGASNVNLGRATVKVIHELSAQNAKYSAFDDYWFLLAAPAVQEPQFRPFSFFEPEAPELVARISNDDPEVFNDDHYRFGVRGNFGIGYRAPWMTIGSTGVS